MTKTLLFYGNDAKAAKSKNQSDSKSDSVQIVQADAYQGERMEADQIEFMDDVPADQRARIEAIWGKFDNRVSTDPAKVGGAAELGTDPAANRANLTNRRPDNPDDVEAKQLEHPGVAKKAGMTEDKSLEDHKGIGLDANTGKPVTDRNKIPR